MRRALPYIGAGLAAVIVEVAVLSPTVMAPVGVAVSSISIAIVVAASVVVVRYSAMPFALLLAAAIGAGLTGALMALEPEDALPVNSLVFSTLVLAAAGAISAVLTGRNQRKQP